MSQSQQCLSCYMIQERHSRNADFISIAAKGGYPQPSGHRPVKPKNPPAEGRSNFRTFFRPSEPFEPSELGPLCGPIAIPRPSAQRAVAPFHTTRAGRCPLFSNCGVSRHHNPRAIGPSNLRTLRPKAGQTLEPFSAPLNLLNPLNPATQWLHGRFLSISNPMFHCTYRTVIL